MPEEYKLPKIISTTGECENGVIAGGRRPHSDAGERGQSSQVSSVRCPRVRSHVAVTTRVCLQSYRSVRAAPRGTERNGSPRHHPGRVGQAQPVHGLLRQDDHEPAHRQAPGPHAVHQQRTTDLARMRSAALGPLPDQEAAMSTSARSAAPSATSSMPLGAEPDKIQIPLAPAETSLSSFRL